jgi:anti-sigma B factor antagonist
MLDITTERNNGIAILRLTGRVISASARAFEERLLALVAEGETRFILDFRQCEFIDSSGIRVLLILLKKLNAASGALAVFGVSGHILQVFTIAGLARLFRIEESETAAVAALG